MIKKYIHDLKQEFSGYNLSKLSSDLLAGLTVCAVALPLALAFGVSSGATPEAGLVTAILSGIIMSLLSGASYQISGPTGAMSAILMIIVAQSGLNGVFLASLIAGVIIFLCGIFKLGKLVKLIPMPVVTGFTSGIAIIIALGQIDNFFGTQSLGETALQKIASYAQLGFSPNIYSVICGLSVVAIMLIYPKKWNAKLPSSLVSIIIVGVMSYIFGFEKFGVELVSDIPKTLFLKDRLDLGSINLSAIVNAVSPAITIAALGMIESLLCGASASRMKNEQFDADRELVSQGIGNIIIPFFGGVPSTAAIARTSVAIKSGCQTRLCGVFHSLALLASMFLLGPLMAKLPLSALAGVLMVTAWRMNEWHMIKEFFSKKMVSAISKFLITMISTVVFDLTVAIIIGVVYSFVLFAVKSARLSSQISDSQHGTVIELEGAVAFVTVPKLRTIISDISCGCFKYSDGTVHECKNVILNMEKVSLIDTSGIYCLIDIKEEFNLSDIALEIINIPKNHQPSFIKAGLLD